jgi:hypothetical protein
MRISRSGSPGRGGNYRNVGHGHQPTGSHYASRSSHFVSHTSYGDQQTPYISSARPATTSHHAMEHKALKSRTRCNCCGRLGHWWQECLDRDRSHPIRASLADALPMHNSSSLDDFSLFLSHMSALDVEAGSYEAQYHGSPEPQLSSDSSSTPNIISRAYMASEVITSFDIQNSCIAESGANKHMSHDV